MKDIWCLFFLPLICSFNALIYAVCVIKLTAYVFACNLLVDLYVNVREVEKCEMYGVLQQGKGEKRRGRKEKVHADYYLISLSKVMSHPAEATEGNLRSG